ncbi:protein of unknown function [Hyphomicrobium sp. MC1]|nr:protein of unknown function [Hyphomicrobium sp. MC1]
MNRNQTTGPTFGYTLGEEILFNDHSQRFGLAAVRRTFGEQDKRAAVTIRLSRSFMSRRRSR